MEFLVLGFDGTDEGAPGRRLAARGAHLEQGKRWFESGRWLYAAGILDEDGRLTGSMIVADFPSREAIEADWLAQEPYVLGRVWETVEVRRAQSAPFVARNGSH